MSEIARKRSAMAWLRSHGVEFRSIKLKQYFSCTFDVIINHSDGTTSFKRLRILPEGFLGGCVEV